MVILSFLKRICLLGIIVGVRVCVRDYNRILGGQFRWLAATCLIRTSFNFYEPLRGGSPLFSESSFYHCALRLTSGVCLVRLVALHLVPRGCSCLPLIAIELYVRGPEFTRQHLIVGQWFKQQQNAENIDVVLV